MDSSQYDLTSAEAHVKNRIKTPPSAQATTNKERTKRPDKTTVGQARPISSKSRNIDSTASTEKKVPNASVTAKSEEAAVTEKTRGNPAVNVTDTGKANLVTRSTSKKSGESQSTISRARKTASTQNASSLSSQHAAQASSTPERLKQQRTTRKASTTYSDTKEKKTKDGKGAVGKKSLSVSGEMRDELIALLAYRRAERRGFAPGNEEEDWLEAESEIDLLIARLGELFS
jgi:hypothetical protein